jgi:hypothetical protein
MKECPTCSSETYIGAEEIRTLCQEAAQNKQLYGDQNSLELFQQGLMKASQSCHSGRMRCDACEGTGCAVEGAPDPEVLTVLVCGVCSGEGHVQCTRCRGTGHIAHLSTSTSGMRRCARCQPDIAEVKAHPLLYTHVGRDQIQELAEEFEKLRVVFGEQHLSIQQSDLLSRRKTIPKGKMICESCHGMGADIAGIEKHNRIRGCSRCAGNGYIRCADCFGLGWII